MKQTIALLQAYAPYWNVARLKFDRTDLDVKSCRRVASFLACGGLTAQPERSAQNDKRYPTSQPGESPNRPLSLDTEFCTSASGR